MPVTREEVVLPSDALVIKQVLDSMVNAVTELSVFTLLHKTLQEREPGLQGIKEYEPRVVHQLLDFMYRNVAEVLQVAEVKLY